MDSSAGASKLTERGRRDFNWSLGEELFCWVDSKISDCGRRTFLLGATVTSDFKGASIGGGDAGSIGGGDGVSICDFAWDFDDSVSSVVVTGVVEDSVVFVNDVIVSSLSIDESRELSNILLMSACLKGMSRFRTGSDLGVSGRSLVGREDFLFSKISLAPDTVPLVVLSLLREVDELLRFTFSPNGTLSEDEESNT